jgi:GATA-binding protein, other eukaryote
MDAMNYTTWDNRFAFPTVDPMKQHSAKGPGTMPMSMLSATRRSAGDLPSVFEDSDAAPFEGLQLNSLNYNYPPSMSTMSNPSPSFAPASLPSHGLYGLARMPSASGSAGSSSSPQNRSFPRHVRKTSFDHTIHKDGIFDIVGRHQVNGKPLSPDSMLGTKRRAEAPHAESMLRADPADVDGMGSTVIVNSHPAHPRHLSNGTEAVFVGESASGFPSTAFNFSFPAYGNGMYELGGGTGGGGMADYSGSHHTLHQHRDSIRSSTSGYQSSLESPVMANGDRTVVGVMSDGYAQLGNFSGLDIASASDYRNLMGLVYPSNLENPMQEMYTHIDPTQILGVHEGPCPSGPYTNQSQSPGSDDWNAVGTSSRDSPDPSYNTSNASTPPSTENAPTGHKGMGLAGRKMIALRGAGAPGGDVHQRKKSLPGEVGSPSLDGLRSSTSTPDLSESHKNASGSGSGGKGGGGDEEDGGPTHCTNCQTTNTPLWRRDPEGQPLCEFVSFGVCAGFFC